MRRRTRAFKDVIIYIYTKYILHYDVCISMFVYKDARLKYVFFVFLFNKHTFFQIAQIRGICFLWRCVCVCVCVCLDLDGFPTRSRLLKVHWQYEQM